MIASLSLILFCCVPFAVAAALADGDVAGLCDHRRVIAGDASASTCQSGASFDLDHRGVPDAHGHIVHDLFRRRAIRALPARPGDRGAGGAALRKPQGGGGGDPADAGGPRGGLSVTAGGAVGISEYLDAAPSLTAVAGGVAGIAMSLNALVTLLLVPLAVTLLVR